MSDVPAPLTIFIEAPGDYSIGREVHDVFYPRKLNLDPCERISLAILEQAITEYDHAPTSAEWIELKAQAERWIRQEGTGWLFSFDSICERLNLSPSAARRAILTGGKAGHRKQRNYTWKDPTIKNRKKRLRVSVAAPNRLAVEDSTTQRMSRQYG